MATRTAALDRFFRISERDSTVGREVRGGLVTFVTMAYIVVLNPLIIGSFADDPAHTDKFGGWLPVDQVAAVTALVAGVMTILFGLVANYPFAMATGLGINAFVAVSIAPQMSWPAAMGLVLVNGVVVLILVVTGVRTAVFNAVPANLKAAIAVGIGLFITLIGLVDAGFVRRLPDAADTTVPVGLGINGSIASWPTLTFVVGLILTGILVAKRVKGGILIGVIATTVFAIVLEAIVDAGPSLGTNPKGWNLGYPALPDQVVDSPNLSLVGDVNFDAWVQVPIITALLLVFTLVLTDFFDTIGTMTGLGKEAGPGRRGRQAAQHRQGAVRRRARRGRRRCGAVQLQHRLHRVRVRHRRRARGPGSRTSSPGCCSSRRCSSRRCTARCRSRLPRPRW